MRIKSAMTEKHCFLTVFQVAYVPSYELEVGPLLGGDQGLHFVKVSLVTGGEIVQANYALIEFEQSF
jgi:hypothetical protein